MPKPRRKDKGKASEKPAGDTTSGEEDSDTSLVDILLELKSFRAETSKNFSEIKKEIHEIKEDVKELKARVGTAEERIAENQSRNIEMTQVLIQVLRKQKLLEEKCDDIESRSRRKNLRVYSVPEKAEGNSMMDFIKKLLNEKLGIAGAHIERAHRAASGKGGHTGSIHPRSILARFQSYEERQRVLQAAWSKKEILLNERRIYFDEDFTAQVNRERAKYRLARKELRERNIKTRILYPAKLKVFAADRKIQVFESPEAAAKGLQEFGIAMECPTKELDLESILQAAGWQSPRSKSRTGHVDNLMPSLKKLLQPTSAS
ncbi:unnamed protein product [Knipowitschia caucasica]|uniref:Uncharacterized protein n=1 Tax=Knipowitschia caucasica TaxID=637954 RepID=A0AAV2JW48_KNICA